MPTGDGRYVCKEMPGSENYKPPLFGLRVFEEAALMFRVVSQATLTRYAAGVERLVSIFAEAWHVVVIADDKARAELSDRLRLRFHGQVAGGGSMPPDLVAASPWSCVPLPSGSSPKCVGSGGIACFEGSLA